jgi:hypothetical protein
MKLRMKNLFERILSVQDVEKELLWLVEEIGGHAENVETDIISDSSRNKKRRTNMDKVAQYFQNAWNELTGEYKRWKYWNEQDVVVALVSFVNKHLPNGLELEVHTNVSLSPDTWPECEILKRCKTKLKESSGRFPKIDIVILNVKEMEKKAEPFKLAAEVKFSAFVENKKKGITSRWEKEFQGDITRLEKLLSLEMCESAFFCYLDEYHKREDVGEIKKKINIMKEKQKKLLHYCYWPLILNEKSNRKNV